MRISTFLLTLTLVFSVEAQFPQRIRQFVQNKIAQKVKETLNSKCETEDLCGDGLTGSFRKMELEDCSEFVDKTVPEPQMPEINPEKLRNCEIVSEVELWCQI